ncbi:MAG TPA: tryptophan--tRNA ligase [Christensenellaceae bacterium]|nr:tryptophan--tRNA ligase [Christensenellaceae bacterium]
MTETKIKTKPILFSGVQPSGAITIGNYIGAIRNFVLLKDSYRCLFSIVDLHALTVRREPALLRRRTVELAALYIACGLDPEENLIYCQSHVPEHAELTWILSCYTYMGELSRMTQFKAKSETNSDNINAGLFTYPVLMAADILLYQTQIVPVGADQKQHLEITRDIAQRFNALYGDVFVVPEVYMHKETAKIMSLSDPSRKMSKSDPEESYISLLDSPDDIRRKLKRAVTDSDTNIAFDPENKPGVSNLITIYSALSGDSVEKTVKHFNGKGYGDLKKEVTEVVIESLKPIQDRFNELIKDKQYINGILKYNAERAGSIAQRTLRKVYKKVGLYQL